MFSSSRKFSQNSSSQLANVQNSQQIDFLYREFQNLKQQIYGKNNHTQKIKEPKWDDQVNKSKAKDQLRESNIRKYQKQFNENISQIDKYYNQSIKQKKRVFLEERQGNDMRQSNDMEAINNNISKKLVNSGYEENQLQKQEFEGQKQHFLYGQEMFKQFLKNPQRSNLYSQSLSQTQKLSSNFDIKPIQKMLEQLTMRHQQQLSNVFQTVNFLLQRLKCLEMILEEYSKIMRSKRQMKEINTRKQSMCIVGVKKIEERYEEEIKELVGYYEEKIKKIEKKCKEEVRQMKKQSEFNLKNRVDEESTKMKRLLEEAKRLIFTKEELILSLNQENDQLRGQIERWKQKQVKIQKIDSSLLYSATKQSQQKPKTLQIQKNNKQKQQQKQKSKQWDQFQNNSQDNIDYSELASVKDRSLQEWDISHLQIKQESNAKSAERDGLQLLCQNIDRINLQQQISNHNDH